MQPKYKRMLKGMQKKQHNKLSEQRKREGEANPHQWHVYILECQDGTYYTGITNDLERRFKQHNTGKGARYTRARLPVTLLYQETCHNRTEALVRECAIKALPRARKEKLVYP